MNNSSPLKLSTHSILASICVLAFCAHTSGAVLADFPFTGNSLSSIDVDEFSFASDLVVGAGVSASTFSGTGIPSPSFAMIGAVSSTEEFTVAASRYFEITLTPVAGFELDLTSFTLQYSRSNAGAPTNMLIRSSADGFTANLFTDGTIPQGSFETGNISLAGAEFQNVASAITFRIYAFGASTGTSSLRIDNIAINGTTSAIPEPRASLLFGCGVLATLILRRQRRRNSGSSKQA